MYNINTVTLNSTPVTTTTKRDGLSDRYSLIPTTDICNTLQEAGWEFTSGTARRTRSEARSLTAAHVLRFRNQSLPKVGDNSIEAVGHRCPRVDQREIGRSNARGRTLRFARTH